MNKTLRKMKQLYLVLLMACFSIASAQPVNNDCSGAVNLPVSADITCTTTTATFLDATASLDAITCTPIPNQDIWFEFTAINTRHRVNFSQITNATPYFALYTGSCGSLVQHSCGIGNTTFNELIIGQTYKLRVYVATTNPVNATFTVCINTPPPAISINTDYTTEQLVNDVLMNSSCIITSNISSTAITNPGTVSTIGYYNQNQSSFASTSGIVLSTGNIANLPGPTGGTISGSGTGTGDADLQGMMNNYGLTGTYNDVSSIEFDFVPMIDFISFDFIFASNEYGNFQCNFSDAFAFILTDLTTGVKTNLAVIPNTTTPVLVTTIRNNLYNANCPSANASYFDEYYGSSPLAPINMLGVTVPMTAESAVIPGNPYHIKLVIGDYMDMALDSAVFIDAGSFNIGSPEYAELTVSGGSVLCDGQSATIHINLDDSFTFAWSLNGVLIPGETGNSITVTQGGVYSVSVTLSSGCTLQFSTLIEAGDSGSGTIAELQDYVVFEANTDGISEFDLNTQTDILLEGANASEFVVSYYLTPEDASEQINQLPLIYTNIDNPQTIYVRIGNTQNSCFAIRSLTLIVVDQNFVAPAPTGAADQNFAPGATLADIVVDGENIQWYDNPGSAAGRSGLTDDTPLPMSTLLVDNTTYYASQTINGIESIERLAVTVHMTMITEEYSLTSLTYYPNPVKDVLTLTNDESIEQVMVYNLIGQLVHNKFYNSTHAEVNLVGLTNGVYMIKVKSAGNEKTIKVVKE